MLFKSLLISTLAGGSLFAAAVAPGFSGSYTLVDLGPAPGVSPSYGGLLISPADSNSLLIGGNANSANGEIDSISVVRDPSGHITGFSGTASKAYSAPFIDGGLVFAPNGDLLYTAYPTNNIGQIEPGSTAPDKVVGAPVPSSVGSLQFIPAGAPGAGSFVVGSYSSGTFCTSTLTPDGTGTYDISGCANQVTTGSGPEGIVYVPQGSALFPVTTVLISEYVANRVSAYTVDVNGLPVTASRQDFITGLGGAEGAAIDPVTGDFLFSSFGGTNHVYAVQGFVAPASATPEPGTMVLLGTALLGVYGLRRRSTRHQ